MYRFIRTAGLISRSLTQLPNRTNVLLLRANKYGYSTLRSRLALVAPLRMTNIRQFSAATAESPVSTNASTTTSTNRLSPEEKFVQDLVPLIDDGQAIAAWGHYSKRGDIKLEVLPREKQTDFLNLLAHTATTRISIRPRLRWMKHSLKLLGDIQQPSFEEIAQVARVQITTGSKPEIIQTLNILNGRVDEGKVSNDWDPKRVTYVYNQILHALLIDGAEWDDFENVCTHMNHRQVPENWATITVLTGAQMKLNSLTDGEAYLTSKRDTIRDAINTAKAEEEKDSTTTQSSQVMDVLSGTYNVIASQYAAVGDLASTERIYTMAREDGIIPDRSLLGSYIKAHVKTDQIEKGEQAFFDIVATPSFKPSEAVTGYNELLRGYYVANRFEDVDRIFEKFVSAASNNNSDDGADSQRLLPDATTLKCLIQYHVKTDQVDKIQPLITQLTAPPIQMPMNGLVYNLILRVYSNLGRPEDTERVYNEFKRHRQDLGEKPFDRAFRDLVCVNGMVKQWDKMKEWVLESKEVLGRWNASVFTDSIECFLRADQMDLALSFRNEMQKQLSIGTWLNFERSQMNRFQLLLGEPLSRGKRDASNKIIDIAQPSKEQVLAKLKQALVVLKGKELWSAEKYLEAIDKELEKNDLSTIVKEHLEKTAKTELKA